MALRRVFTSRTEQQTQKIVIIGIDFGTSFTKVYFNQGGEVKQPIQFEVNGSESFFLPTELYYNSNENKLYFHKNDKFEVLKYFKYSMINDGLLTNKELTQKNTNLKIKPEFLCSVYYLAYLIKEVKKQISEILKTTDIKYTINMGCPIDNFGDRDKGTYDKALSVAYQLSEVISNDGMTIEDLFSYYNSNIQKEIPNLQTIPELYAEALWFIEQPSTGEGIYTILDIGGGTVDFASIAVSRTEEGEKKTKIYSQNVMPLGIEILLQYMYPNEYNSKRDSCIECLKTNNVHMPFGWEPKHNDDRELKKAHEFDVQFASGIAEVKERNTYLMEEQNSKRKEIPYYSFGGGADFNWYHSIISSHSSAFSKTNIPPLKRKTVQLNNIPHNRLIIAEQLTRSSFPEIEGFPWQFNRKCLFSGINGKEPFIREEKTDFDLRYELEDRQKEIYGD